MQVIATDGLRAGYATGDVLQGVSIHVDAGEIVGVLGRNGVGKTTLMRALIGLLPARTGSIRFRDVDVTSSKRINAPDGASGTSRRAARFFRI